MTSPGHLDERRGLVFRNEVRFFPPVGAHSGLKSATKYNGQYKCDALVLHHTCIDGLLKEHFIALKPSLAGEGWVRRS